MSATRQAAAAVAVAVAVALAAGAVDDFVATDDLAVGWAEPVAVAVAVVAVSPHPPRTENVATTNA